LSKEFPASYFWYVGKCKPPRWVEELLNGQEEQTEPLETKCWMLNYVYEENGASEVKLVAESEEEATEAMGN